MAEVEGIGVSQADSNIQKPANNRIIRLYFDLKSNLKGKLRNGKSFIVNSQASKIFLKSNFD